MRIAEKDVFGNERYEMKIGVPREIHPGEQRVAASPKNVERLKKMGFEVAVEASAGTAASFPDTAYVAAGAEIVADAATLWSDADIVLKVRPPAQHPRTGAHEANMLREGGTLISFIWPGENKDVVAALQARKATVLAMDCVPRITRAQKLDALSSMANIAGYRSVIEAAQHFGRFFTGLNFSWNTDFHLIPFVSEHIFLQRCAWRSLWLTSGPTLNHRVSKGSGAPVA